MIKSELVQRIADQNPHLHKRHVEIFVNTVLGKVTSVLSAGERVEIRGFGVFSVRTRPPRTGRNPKTGEKVAVPPKRMPFFRMGKEMRQRLNGDKSVDFAERHRYSKAKL